MPTISDATIWRISLGTMLTVLASTAGGAAYLTAFRGDVQLMTQSLTHLATDVASLKGEVTKLVEHHNGTNRAIGILETRIRQLEDEIRVLKAR